MPVPLCQPLSMASKKDTHRHDDPLERAKAWLTKDDDERWKAGVSAPSTLHQTNNRCPKKRQRKKENRETHVQN